MRTFKIFHLIFILPITLNAQSNEIVSNEKLLLNLSSTPTTRDSALVIKQQLIKIINKSDEKNRIEENYLIDSLISQSVSGSNYKFLFDYNNEDRIVEMRGYDEMNGECNIQMKVEYFYDAFNNLVREIYFDWNSVGWDSSLQIIYLYNPENQRTSTTIRDYLFNTWENVVRTSYTYNTNGNEIIALNELWQNDKWINDLIVYSYYPSGIQRDSILIQIWDGNDWQYFSRSSFYYNPITFFLELVVAEFWTGNGFQNYIKLSITSDQIGNQIQQLQQIWNGSDWVNDIKWDYTYHWYYIISCYSERWNGTNWAPADLPITIKNPDGFELGLITQSINIYYIIVNVEPSPSNIPNNFSLSQNYPNPFNPSTTISFQLPEQSFISLKVYDAIGTEVETIAEGEYPAGVHEVIFNADNLSSGLYLYRIISGKNELTRKMILIK